MTVTLTSDPLTTFRLAMRRSLDVRPSIPDPCTRKWVVSCVSDVSVRVVSSTLPIATPYTVTRTGGNRVTTRTPLQILNPITEFFRENSVANWLVVTDTTIPATNTNNRTMTIKYQILKYQILRFK